MRVWVNGAISDVEAASVHVLDHGFTVGDGVFETLKTVDGRPFALTRHLRRLVHSANGMLLAPPDLDRVRAGVAAVMEPHPLGRLRITYTPGRGAAGSARDPRAASTLVITHVEAAPWPDEARVITVPWPRNERSPVSGLKTTSYAENVLALARAQQAGADEALFPNTEGDLCEGTGSNVILRLASQPGRWFTPPLSSGALAGITRELALEWCPIEEREIAMSELLDVEAMVLASSTRDLQAVGTLDGRRLAGIEDVPTRELRHQFAVAASRTADP